MPNKYNANCHLEKRIFGQGIEFNDVPDLVGKIFWMG
jgi:hypothetical protein